MEKDRVLKQKDLRNLKILKSIEMGKKKSQYKKFLQLRKGFRLDQ